MCWRYSRAEVYFQSCSWVFRVWSVFAGRAWSSILDNIVVQGVCSGNPPSRIISLTASFRVGRAKPDLAVLRVSSVQALSHDVVDKVAHWSYAQMYASMDVTSDSSFRRLGFVNCRSRSTSMRVCISRRFRNLPSVRRSWSSGGSFSDGIGRSLVLVLRVGGSSYSSSELTMRRCWGCLIAILCDVNVDRALDSQG